MVAALFIVLGASFIVYMLMTKAGDPLAWLVEIKDPIVREQTRKSVVSGLRLDVHPIPRYFGWLWDLLRGDFGISARTRLPVSEDLGSRLLLTLKLVTASTILSVVLGIAVGIVTALRQYTGFDYVVTFFTFVFFSLPVFWVAVILKKYGGIDFNDWLRDGAHFSPTVIVIFALCAGGISYTIAGGPTSRRAAIGAAGGVGVGLLVWYISASQWMLNPRFGPIVLPQAQVDELMKDAEKGANATVTVDLEKQEITRPDGGVIKF
ncbi:MAG TPA: hypothetical protein PLV68_14695, partial [Ilumatobacteraceae bacterium]|nr:hypothetical protein [Ilumatobacteraceae bacterium]